MKRFGNPRGPVTRYVGGKWRLAPWVISHFPQHRCYVEPFGGMASVLVRKPRSMREIYNDKDLNVVNLFRVMQDPRKASALVHRLQYTPFAREEYNLVFETTDDPIERACRLVIKCMMGFGSGRKGRSGFKGVWADDHIAEGSWRIYVHRLPALIDRLQGVVIENMDALDLMRVHDDPSTLFYVDPPYLMDAAGKIQYYNLAFSHEDQHKLLKLLTELEGMVVLSGFNSDLYNSVLRGWTVVTTDARGMSRTDPNTVEVLWLNAAAARRKSKTLF